MEKQKAKLELKKYDLTSADQRRKPIIEEVIRKNGTFPNMYAYMINSPGLLETYLHGYEQFRKESGFSPAEQEVVFLTLSYENNCDYCMAAHSVIADKMSNLSPEVTDAIRTGGEISDAKLRALSTFTKEMFSTRGWPSIDALNDFFKAGYDERKVLEIILALAVKTLSNYSNHLSDPELDAMFRDRSWNSGK